MNAVASSQTESLGTHKNALQRLQQGAFWLISNVFFYIGENFGWFQVEFGWLQMFLVGFERMNTRRKAPTSPPRSACGHASVCCIDPAFVYNVFVGF